MGGSYGNPGRVGRILGNELVAAPLPDNTVPAPKTEGLTCPPNYTFLHDDHTVRHNGWSDLHERVHWKVDSEFSNIVKIELVP